jgi:hypothetical protein
LLKNRIVVCETFHLLGSDLELSLNEILGPNALTLGRIPGAPKIPTLPNAQKKSQARSGQRETTQSSHVDFSPRSTRLPETPLGAEATAARGRSCVGGSFGSAGPGRFTSPLSVLSAFGRPRHRGLGRSNPGGVGREAAA